VSDAGNDPAVGVPRAHRVSVWRRLNLAATISAHSAAVREKFPDMRLPLSLLLLALVSWPLGPAAAFDPRETDILGLRLGMNPQDVLHNLAAQGADPSRIDQEVGACTANARGRCILAVTAPTPDGTLLIRFAARAGPGSEAVWSIAYTLAGRGAGEPDMIRAAVLNRFGPPVSADPLLWCGIVDRHGCNPPDQPQLTFVDGPKSSSTLTLSDPGAVQPAP
jgi:hypothetical protein